MSGCDNCNKETTVCRYGVTRGDGMGHFVGLFCSAKCLHDWVVTEYTTEHTLLYETP